jgi:CSLREA domain-containing protein
MRLATTATRTTTLTRIAIATAVTTAIGIVSTSAPASAASIVVNSVADNSLGNLAANGTCDLREAIEAANTDAPVGECAAGNGADVITFTVTGTIVLNSTAGQLNITDDLTITGPGATQLAISGNNLTRVLRIGFEQSLTMSGLTIQNGWVPNDAINTSGAGIHVQGSLTAHDIVVKDNQSGGDDCGGCSAGGIHVQGGPLVLSNSTISGNVAGGSSSGGGISQDPNTTMTLTNVTISSNRTGLTGNGGGVYVTGDAQFNNVTVTNNLSRTGGGVGVGASGVLTISNTIIAGNLLDGVSASGPDCGIVQQGSIDSQDYNLIGDLSGCTIGGTTTHNVTGGAMLGALQNNGGQTPTHALADTSPAVDAADPGSSCATTDQRGVARPIDGDAVPGAICDIGAYEKAALPPPSTTAPSTTATPTTIGSGPTIPKTGAPETAWQTAAIALALVLMGATILLVTRRRPTA